MSLTADLYVAASEEAIAYDETPDRFPDRAQFSSITPLEMSTLRAIMEGREWEVEDLDDFACLLEISGGERLIHRLPPEMVAALASSDPQRIEALARDWAKTEELDCPPAEIRPVLDALVRLSKIAIASARGVFLWNSL